MYGISADQITELQRADGFPVHCSSAAAASYRSPRPTPGSPPGAMSGWRDGPTRRLGAVGCHRLFLAAVTAYWVA